MGARVPPTFIRHRLASILSCSTILRACPILIVLFTGVSPFILEKREGQLRALSQLKACLSLFNLYKTRIMPQYFILLLSPPCPLLSSSSLSHPCLPQGEKWTG
jgi:hypothetical protein